MHVLLAAFGFADLIADTLPANKRALGAALGSFRIATKDSDDDTIAVAAEHAADGSVSVLVTDAWHARGAKINRAGVIRMLLDEARAACARDGDFLLLLDADIALPPDFAARLVPELERRAAAARAEGRLGDTMFGMKRRVFATRAEFVGGGSGQDGVLDATMGGDEAFLGFFQLVHASALHRYAEFSDDVSQADGVFARMFKFKELLDGRVAHLGLPGRDWGGRVSRAWTRR